MYAKDISKKVKSARAVSARQGKFMGSKAPYGYIKSPEDRHKLIIDPVASEIVRRIFTEYAYGDSGRNIASKLNIENVDNPKTYHYKQLGKCNPLNENQAWGSNTVIQLLKNQVYIGHIVQGKRAVTSFKTKKRHFTSEDDWIIVENTHEPVIESDIWEQVQKRIGIAKTKASNNTICVNSTNNVNLFSGIIRCADCGSSMAYNRKVYKGSDRVIYRCSRYANQGKEQCSTHSINQETLEQVILNDMKYYAQAAVKDEKSLIDRLMSVSGKERAKEQSAKRQNITKLQKRIDVIDKMVKQLFEEKVSGNLTDTMFRKMMSDYENERKELDKQIYVLENELQTTNDTEKDVLSWVGLIKKCLSLESLDRETAYRLIENISVSEKTVLDGKKHQNILIQYNFVGCLD